MYLLLRRAAPFTRDRVRLHVFFFFQAEDGIRDSSVTGVQTCALPICCFLQRQPGPDHRAKKQPLDGGIPALFDINDVSATSTLSHAVSYSPASGSSSAEIGRASCRERV